MQVHMHDGRPIKMWVDSEAGEVPVERAAMAQLQNIASLPFIFKHVAAMPDVHLGMGATVGSVIPTKGAVIPAAVGVDIGCGMDAYPTAMTKADLPEDLGPVRAAIEAAVPHGRTNHGGRGDKGAWAYRQEPGLVARAWAHLAEDNRFDRLTQGYPEVVSRNAHPMQHLGTLGTGNHFIELCLDQDDQVWLMLHSGSRGIGNRLASHFIKLAKRLASRWFINLPDTDLAYFPQGTEQFDDYMDAVLWAQQYARVNRNIMLTLAFGAVQSSLGRTDAFDPTLAVSCHHNYVTWEHHFGQNVLVTRKGAVNASEGTLGIIPGSMGQKSFIVRGKGNPESFNSCSHGAGRVMSRNEARRTFTLQDLAFQTAGVECRKDADVIDEIPGSYKDLDLVMAAQADLVEIVHTLKAVLCVKG